MWLKYFGHYPSLARMPEGRRVKRRPDVIEVGKPLLLNFGARETKGAVDTQTLIPTRDSPRKYYETRKN